MLLYSFINLFKHRIVCAKLHRFQMKSGLLGKRKARQVTVNSCTYIHRSLATANISFLWSIYKTFSLCHMSRQQQFFTEIEIIDFNTLLFCFKSCINSIQTYFNQNLNFDRKPNYEIKCFRSPIVYIKT